MRPSYILIPSVAAVVAISVGDKGYGWPFVGAHFLLAVAIIFGFAKLGNEIFGRRR